MSSSALVVKELSGNRSHATRKSVYVPFRQSRIFQRCTLAVWAAGLNMRIGVHGQIGLADLYAGSHVWETATEVSTSSLPNAPGSRSNCEMPMQRELVWHHGNPLCDNTCFHKGFSEHTRFPEMWSNQQSSRLDFSQLRFWGLLTEWKQSVPGENYF